MLISIAVSALKMENMAMAYSYMIIVEYIWYGMPACYRGSALYYKWFRHNVSPLSYLLIRAGCSSIKPPRKRWSFCCR